MLKIKNKNKRSLGKKFQGLKTDIKLTDLSDFIESPKYLEWVCVGCNYLNSDYSKATWDPIFNSEWTYRYNDFSDIVSYFSNKPLESQNNHSSILKWLSIGPDFLYKTYFEIQKDYNAVENPITDMNEELWKFFDGFKRLSFMFDLEENRGNINILDDLEYAE